MRLCQPSRKPSSSIPLRGFHSQNSRSKARQPFTEHYSVVGPEVTKGPKGETLGKHNDAFIEELKEVDAMVIAGQAKSHCVAWTISDLLDDIRATDPELAKKVYLLEDCTSPVVVPGVDFTDQANEAFETLCTGGDEDHQVNRCIGIIRKL